MPQDTVMWTFPPKRILVAVDFGDASSHAVRVAGALAARFDARLTALHAESLEVPPYFTHGQIEALEHQQVETRARAARYLEKHASHLTPVPVEALVTDGPAGAALLDAADRHDLLVIGTHGRRGPSRWWLGSVAERVVRGTPVPVVVVRASDEQHPPAAHFRRILLVTGGDAIEPAAERYAASLADSFEGQPVERLTHCTEESAARREASLLVTSVPAHPGGRLSDIAERLIRTCRVPMLFVPEERRASAAQV